MILLEIGLREREAFALLGDDVHDARALERLHNLEGMQHLRDVVPVDRPEVAEAQLFEQHPGRPQVFDALFDVPGEVNELLAADDVGRALDQMLHALADPHRDRTGDDGPEVFVERTDVGRDRHAVVVQDDDDVATRVARVVQGLVGQAAGHRAVADDRHDFELLALQVPRRRHAERRRQRGPRVAGTELIVRALVAPQEAGEAPLLAQRIEPVVPPGENLPRIALMADVPNDLVARRVKRSAERDRQFDDPEPRADMAAGLGDHVDQTLPHLVGERLQLLGRQCLDVFGTVNRFENQLDLVTM